MGTPFLKMNGLGNDFVVLDARARPLALSSQTIRAMADRKRGIGCDQFIVLEPGLGGADTRMRIWNADGDEVGACGNATRCIADWLGAELGKETLTIDTDAGRLIAERLKDGRVSVDMGRPRFGWEEIPLSERMDTRVLDIKLGPIDAPVLFGPSAVNVGNPHCIFFVDDVAKHDISRFGPMIENYPLFPERANVSIAQILARDHIRLRVWERGVGMTQACGTAACAVVPAAVRKGLSARKATVTLDGGDLEIEWREGDDHILMTGPVALNFEGVWPQDLSDAEKGAA
ncbi:MAG: diaminopimelate epimerase [Alphaproteobacteria bacterium]|nr:diaminopimelate epimerase [Alphaproteobacteria bacterium]